ncbi:hypothetical protein FUT79_06550 [Treponema phagedenis]|nr:hypothetical protein FUT79_06550 [Treponema phagedenis]
MEPPPSVAVLILTSMSKPNLRVLKLYKQFCFKTSLLLGTTGVRARSDFAVRGKTKPVCMEPPPRPDF